MSIATDIRTLLAAEGTISAVVGTSVFSVAASPKTGNAQHIIVTTLDTDHHPTQQPDAVATNVRTAQVDIDCMGPSKDKADAVATVVKAYIDDFTGLAGNATIKAVDLQGEADDFEYLGQGEGLPLFTSTVDVQVTFI